MACLLTECVKNVGGDGDPDQEEKPDPAFKNIVIVQEFFPGMFHYVMAEDKLERDGKG